VKIKLANLTADPSPLTYVQKIRKMVDTDSGITWITNPLNHGDFTFYFLIVLQYTEYYNSEWAAKSGKYHVEIKAVSTEAAGPTELAACNESMGGSSEDPAWQHIQLAEYGIAAVLWQDTGRNMAKLLRKAREQLKITDMIFGFAMDRIQNGMGATGWDFIKGEFTPSKVE